MRITIVLAVCLIQGSNTIPATFRPFTNASNRIGAAAGRIAGAAKNAFDLTVNPGNAVNVISTDGDNGKTKVTKIKETVTIKDTSDSAAKDRALTLVASPLSKLRDRASSTFSKRVYAANEPDNNKETKVNKSITKTVKIHSDGSDACASKEPCEECETKERTVETCEIHASKAPASEKFWNIETGATGNIHERLLKDTEEVAVEVGKLTAEAEMKEILALAGMDFDTSKTGVNVEINETITIDGSADNATKDKAYARATSSLGKLRDRMSGGLRKTITEIHSEIDSDVSEAPTVKPNDKETKVSEIVTETVKVHGGNAVEALRNDKETKLSRKIIENIKIHGDKTANALADIKKDAKATLGHLRNRLSGGFREMVAGTTDIDSRRAFDIPIAKSGEEEEAMASERITETIKIHGDKAASALADMKKGAKATLGHLRNRLPGGFSEMVAETTEIGSRAFDTAKPGEEEEAKVGKRITETIKIHSNALDDSATKMPNEKYGLSARFTSLKDLMNDPLHMHYDRGNGAWNTASSAIKIAQTAAAHAIEATRKNLNEHITVVLDIASSLQNNDELSVHIDKLQGEELHDTIKAVLAEISTINNFTQIELVEAVKAAHNSVLDTVERTTRSWSAGMSAVIYPASEAGVDISSCLVESINHLAAETSRKAAQCMTDKVTEIVELKKSMDSVTKQCVDITKQSAKKKEDCSQIPCPVARASCEKDNACPVAHESASLLKKTVSNAAEATRLVSTFKSELSICVTAVVAEKSIEAATHTEKIAKCVSDRIDELA